MVSRIYTVAFQGIETKDILVEAQMAPGLPAFNIVGLPDKAVAESRERIRASLHSMGLALPAKRIIVNLAPADLQKEGSHYDLPLALSLMGAMGILDPLELSHYCALGELGLDGSINRVSGVLPAAMNAAVNKRYLICPQSCGSEAAWAGDLQVLAAPHLLSIINHFKGTQILTLPKPHLPVSQSHTNYGDMADIRGQAMAKRVLEITAAGGHNLLMLGPPGAGKSMLAQRLPTILPPLNAKEALEVTMIHSLAGLLPEHGLITQRPFRDPHHSASLPALVGGGARAKPGEMSLAHRGILFLDELPEFSRQTLEALRQPLETRYVVVARANHHVRYPAHIQLIAAMNPCRCGFFGDLEQQCHQAPRCANDYQSKISGPLMDRFDLILYVPALKPQELLGPNTESETSKDVQMRVIAARERQQARTKIDGSVNADIRGDDLNLVINLESDAEELLSKAIEKLKLSARGYHRILRVSRTIADLANSNSVTRVHLAEAINYRQPLTIGDYK